MSTRIRPVEISIVFSTKQTTEIGVDEQFEFELTVSGNGVNLSRSKTRLRKFQLRRTGPDTEKGANGAKGVRPNADCGSVKFRRVGHVGMKFCGLRG